jgi:putative DNA methylase
VARKRAEPLGWVLGEPGRSELGKTTYLVAPGDYLNDVQPEMRRIVGERVRFFLQQGITGADLNIAAVGAGLAPFTRYARVELPNGEELTAAAYLDEVQAEVVRALLGESARTDSATQYTIMWRDYYGEAWVDFDEANTLARATGVELDSGPDALARGRSALVEKKGAKVRLRDYSERGAVESLGLPTPERPQAPLIDVLHRLLWLAENDQRGISDLLAAAMPDKYLLRLTAQALGGRALAGEPTPGAVRDERTREQRAIDSLLASWRRVIEEGKML